MSSCLKKHVPHVFMSKKHVPHVFMSKKHVPHVFMSKKNMYLMSSCPKKHVLHVFMSKKTCASCLPVQKKHVFLSSCQKNMSSCLKTIFAFLTLNTPRSAHNKIFGAEFLSFE